MTKSRMTVLLLSLAFPSTALADEPVTAEQALGNYRRTFQAPSDLDCPRGDPDAIVVCGRREGEADPDRLPLPVALKPGARVRGEASGSAAMGADSCLRLCQSSVGIDLGMAIKIVNGIGRLLEGDD